MKIVVTGGAGFVASHLTDKLIQMGNQVIVLDNLYCGTLQNLKQWQVHPKFQFHNVDLSTCKLQELLDLIPEHVDQIYHLACPASPDQYWKDPIFTMKTGFLGTLLMLEFATQKKAKLLFTSTSEVYGDPQCNIQSETYNGNVNTFGPRACYDQSKRVAETLCYEYQKKIQVRVARLFNTFGPRLSLEDGRVVSNFIVKALKNEPMTVYGTGQQTRTFIYVSDTIDGIIKLMQSNVQGPVNIGGSEQITVKYIGEIIWRLIRQDEPQYQYLPGRQDDPKVRKPDVRKAHELLNWSQKVDYKDGIKKTIDSFKNILKY